MTRAQQIEVLAGGVTYDGALIATPYAKFLAAGTSTAKNAYADIDKAVAITKKALDAQGRATVYGDGIYKIQIYAGDPDNGGVLKFELDNYRVTSGAGNSRTITTDTIGSRDDGLILADTSTDDILYIMPSAALMQDITLTIKKVVSANTLTYTAISGETIDGVASGSLTDENATIQFLSDGTNWYGAQIVGTASTLGGYSANTGTVPGTIPVRNGSGLLPGSITGNAATATTATEAGTADVAVDLDGGGAGSLPYQASAGETTMLTVGSLGQSLEVGADNALQWGTKVTIGKSLALINGQFLN